MSDETTSNAAKHTPGPWNTNRTLLNGTLVAWHITSAKAGSVDPIANSSADTRRSVDEEADNASLIAAAPDMLEALQHVAAYDAERLGAIGGSLVRAAIAKATGATK